MLGHRVPVVLRRDFLAMSAEIEHSADWIDWLWKALSAVVIPLVGWIWRTNSETIEVRSANKARMEAIEKDVDGVRADIHEIKTGIGNILDHITKTNLHRGGE